MNMSVAAKEKTGQDLSILETEKGIALLKRTFEEYLSDTLNISRVSSPLFVAKNSGIQDNLNGTEKAVGFSVKDIDGKSYEIVHSLAKWKRMALARYGVEKGMGIYTDMNALRPDEESLQTGIHSIYVDQWDWEKTIDTADRDLEFLKETVKGIYKTIRKTDAKICETFGFIPFLPEEITFIHTEDLLEMYPGLSSKERENRVCKEYGAVFLIGIGGEIQNGEPHDGRAPDYDDWSTPTIEGKKGLNGDILVWNPILGRGFELSSMGIRVDREMLKKQLSLRNCPERAELPWHKMLLNGEFPESIGGGIGQSRLSMLLLRKKHIGEVQVSVWPENVRAKCEAEGIKLL